MNAPAGSDTVRLTRTIEAPPEGWNEARDKLETVYS